jgi:hypothetical protein
MQGSAPWAPKILSRGKLDHQRWVYAVEAPFDMPASMSNVIGMRAAIDGRQYEIRGVVPKLPSRGISAGEPIEVLAVGVQDEQAGSAVN